MPPASASAALVRLTDLPRSTSTLWRTTSVIVDDRYVPDGVAMPVKPRRMRQLHEQHFWGRADETSKFSSSETPRRAFANGTSHGQAVRGTAHLPPQS